MADTRQTANAHAVDPRTTARVLAKALEEHARVDLRADSEGVEVACCGTVVGVDDSHLALDVGPAAGMVLGSSVLRAGIEIGHAQYVFETRCADETAEIEPGVIRVVKPDSITPAERRRSPRRQLHEPTEVILRPAGDGDESHGPGAMLNLSPDGIACRIPIPGTEALAIGQTLRVEFRLGASSRAFHLNGRISNITQGGTINHLVVGLEFIADERLTASRERLRKALETTD
ncbi:MAG: PilZ domain-containing protein [Phycisphaerae bacterium]